MKARNETVPAVGTRLGIPGADGKARNEVLRTLAGIALSLCLPVLAAWAGQALSDGQRWALETGAGYRFSGTLENRVSVLAAYGNASPHILRAGREEAAADEGVIHELAEAGLIPPMEGLEIAKTEIIFLSPAQYDSRYAYEKTTAVSGRTILAVTRDAVSGTLLRVELTGAQEALAAWDDAERENVLLRRFLACLGYSQDIDSFGSYGEQNLMKTAFALIPETYLQAAITVSPRAGVLVYQLSAAGSG